MENVRTNEMDFTKAAERLEAVLLKTKIIHSPVFSGESGNEVYIKPENLQRTGSFKIRGAYNKISKTANELKGRGLVAASAGNHAQGVALAAEELGVPALIVMPLATPLIKVEATREYGAEVVLYGDCYDEAYEHALDLAKELQYGFIHPFNDKDIIEGQGTIGLEIMEELPDADIIVVPIGGGGLISGIAMAAKSINPDIEVIGVEPEGAKAMKLSIEKGEIICLDGVCTIADGVAVKNPGDITFGIICEYVDEIVTVSDFEIMEAFLILLEKHKLIGENAGVLSLAALKKLNVKGKKIVCLVSGGNIDVLTISEMIDRGLVARGRIFRFTVDLQDKPGELLKVAGILARMNANVVKLDHNQFNTVDRMMEVRLDITAETNGLDHIRQITTEFHKNGYFIKEM
jgi:threonine dehydratase